METIPPFLHDLYLTQGHDDRQVYTSDIWPAGMEGEEMIRIICPRCEGESVIH